MACTDAAACVGAEVLLYRLSRPAPQVPACDFDAGVPHREYVRACCCWTGDSNAGTKMRVTCRQLGDSRFEGMKTRLRAAAELNAQFETAMLNRGFGH